MQLHKSSVIQLGIPFRSGVTASPSGEVSVIQTRDVPPSGIVDCSDLVRVDDLDVKPHHWIQPGDILFRPRGLTMTSAIVREVPGKTVAAAPLMRIRVSSRDVLPEYLNWFLNQAPAQNHFAGYAKGSLQKMVDIETLATLEVRVPSLDRQQAVVALAALAEQERILMQTLTEKYRQRANKLLMRLLEET